MDFIPGNVYEISRNAKTFSFKFVAGRWDEFDQEIVLVFEPVEGGICLSISAAHMKSSRYEIKEISSAS